MNEQKRTEPRLAVVNHLREIVRRAGFRVILVGEIYELQGSLAKLVESSLIKGIFWLIVFFIVIAVIVARSVRGAAAMIVSLSFIPVCVLGAIGLLRISVDIISAPATNIASEGRRFHGSSDVRGQARSTKRKTRLGCLARRTAGAMARHHFLRRHHRRRFAIFALSSFPPTQRFGLVVVAGTILDILANLFMLPLLGGSEWRNKSRKQARHPEPIPAAQTA